MGIRNAHGRKKSAKRVCRIKREKRHTYNYVMKAAGSCYCLMAFFVFRDWFKTKGGDADE
jgi:hypothetical protein